MRRAQRGTASSGAQLSSKRKSETDQLSYRFYCLVKMVNRLPTEQRRNAGALTAETFATAQWAQGSEAAASLAQMATRGAGGNPALATIVRERQDLAEATNVGRLAEIDARIAAIDKRLAAISAILRNPPRPQSRAHTYQ